MEVLERHRGDQTECSSNWPTTVGVWLPRASQRLRTVATAKGEQS